MDLRYEDKIRWLVRDRFPDHLHLRRSDPPTVEAEALYRYEAKLADMPAADLDELYIASVETVNREREEAANRADRLEFFSHPDASADFPFWCALEKWSINDATALLLEKDPLKVSPNTLSEVRNTSPFRRKFQDLNEKLARAVEDGKLKEGDSPLNFVKLAQTIGGPVPEQLSACFNAGTGIAIEGRERVSLQKLVIGMAVKHYGYNPSDARSQVPSMIAKDLADCELELSPKSIKKHLDHASVLLPVSGNKKDLR